MRNGSVTGRSDVALVMELVPELSPRIACKKIVLKPPYGFARVVGSFVPAGQRQPTRALKQQHMETVYGSAGVISSFRP
jgi:hypothetical protein